MNEKKTKYTPVRACETDYLRKPEVKTLRQTIYDSKHGLLLGRTPLSWFKLLVFYTILYTCLCAFFGVYMHLFFMFNINEKIPKRLLDDSLIGTNPGLGFIPTPENSDQGALIWYQSQNRSTARAWAERVNQALDGYFDQKKLPNQGKDQVICSFDSPPRARKACAVPIQDWSPCTKQEGYSYEKSSPCIFLKLNRIYGWVPEPYNDTEDLPKHMPEDLQLHIKSLPEAERNQVWIHCQGEAPLDRENVGPINYVSRRGFPSYFFPYTNVPDYLSPLVAIRLERPKPNVMINIECRAWAKNIIYHGGRERTGSVVFLVMID